MANVPYEKSVAQLPEEYSTESGVSLNEAGKDEFLVKPNGSKDFGEITADVEEKTNGRMKKAPIRLQVGNDNFGYLQLLKHKSQIEGQGYDVMSYITHILKNFNQIYDQSEGLRRNRFVLYIKGDSSKGFMPVDLTFDKGADGFYTIITVMPHKSKIKGTLIFDGSANPSPATTNGALSTETNNKGGVSSAITHVKNNVPSDFNVPQKKYTSKSYKVSHNKAYKAIMKNGIIAVKDGARGKGILHENDEPKFCILVMIWGEDRPGIRVSTPGMRLHRPMPTSIFLAILILHRMGQKARFKRVKRRSLALRKIQIWRLTHFLSQ